MNHVLSGTNLLEFSSNWLEKVFLNGPVAVGLAMHAVDTGLDQGLEAGLKQEAMSFGVVLGTRDAAEGTKSFLEKRKPMFTGQ